MCSEEVPRPPQGTPTSGHQGLFVTDICPRIMEMTGLVHRRSGWIPTFFTGLLTIPWATFMRSGREERKSDHAVSENSAVPFVA